MSPEGEHLSLIGGLAQFLLCGLLSASDGILKICVAML